MTYDGADDNVLFNTDEYTLSSVTRHIKPRRRLLVLPHWAADTGAAIAILWV